MPPMQFTTGPTNINGDVSINLIVSAKPKRKSPPKATTTRTRAESQDDYRDRQLSEHGPMQKNIRILALEVIDKSFGRLAEIVREGAVSPESLVKLVELAEDPSFLQAHAEPARPVRASLIRKFFSTLRKKIKKFRRFLSLS